MPSFAVRNFGCRVNQAEAFAWADAFHEQGLGLNEDCGRSDVVVVNSCALTGRAERDVRKFIRTVHRENAGARILVTGCYAERAPGELASLPGVAAVVPNGEKTGLVNRALALDAGRGTDWGHVPRARVPDLQAAQGREAVGTVEPSFRARGWLKIQDGCDNRCAYCVIPSVRGRSRSVAAADLVPSVRDLASRGYREIVLAGIHLSSYGRDLEPRGSLADLVRALGEAAGPARLRLSSLDPRQTDGALAARIASDPRVCPHFHFSLQHASARVLELMGRPVEPGSYEALLKDVRRLSPDAALGADLMVGFPGETEADFEELRAFVERSPLTYAHVFSYSPRPGTPAAGLRPVPSGLITARAKSMRRLAALKEFAFRRRFAGREIDGVVIGLKAEGAEVLTGNFIRVIVPACPAPERERVRVAIRKVLPRRTEGEIVA